MTPNQKAFLDMLATSEGTIAVRGSDNGYNVVVGGRLFSSYATHPGDRVWIKSIKQFSTAAGRYQMIISTWSHWQQRLKLPDFSPASQDAAALGIIEAAGAFPDLETGDLPSAIGKCAHIWASLPGNQYGQPVKTPEFLADAYALAGGTLAA